MYAAYLKSIGADVVGVDGSDAMLSMARAKYPDVRFVSADIEKRFRLRMKLMTSFSAIRY